MRSRILDPEFFKDEAVTDLSFECRLVFAGLWCAADREGRFRWSPKRLKLEILPYDDIDFAKLLTQLEDAGLIKSYQTETSGDCGYIPNFLKYQRPHHREHGSTIHEPCMDEARPKQVAPCPPVSVSVSVSNSVYKKQTFKKSKEDSQFEKLAVMWRDMSRSKNNGWPDNERWRKVRPSWLESIKFLITKDGFSEDQFIEVVDAFNSGLIDSGAFIWARHAVKSPNKLRKPDKDGMSYMQVVLNRIATMRELSQPPGDAILDGYTHGEGK